MALSLDGTTGITSDGGTPVIENLDTTATGIAVTGELTTTGNVGIGTSSPSTPLHVYKNSAGATLAIFENPANGMNSAIFKSGATGGNWSSSLLFRDSSNTDLSSVRATADSKLQFFTGATERVSIDSAGRVTMPYQPMCSVYSTTAGFTGSSNTVIPFDSEQVDVGGNYNTSTYRFTAPVAGKYFATVWFLSRNNTSGNCIGLFKNGSAVAGRGGYVDPGSGNEIQGLQTLIIDCAANDYIDARITQYVNGDFYFSDLAGMQIYLIG